MRRVFSLFILSIYLFFFIFGSGYGIPQSNVNLSTSESEIHTRTSTNTSQELAHYTSYRELSSILKNISNKYHTIITVYKDRGKTYEGRTLWMVKISDNPEINEDDETEVLFVGAHHGNELIANEMAIFIIETFTDGYGKDPRITWMVDTHEIWVVPMPNPDGTEYTLNNESWRKNRSPNYSQPESPELIPTSYGTDLARNYDIEWGDPEGPSAILQRSGTYAGSEPFSEFETQAIRDLVLANNFSVYMDYHSGIEMILYPWDYTCEPTSDNAIYEHVAEKLSKLTGHKATKGYDLYQTNGNPIDWIYSETRTIAFTVELSNEYRPDPTTSQAILNNCIKQPLYLTGISADLDLGSRIEIKQGILQNQSTLGPFRITETVNGIPVGSDLEVKIYYKFNNNDYKTVLMHNKEDQPNVYIGEIPKQKSDGVIRYFIAVENDEIMVTLPTSNTEFEFTIKDSSFDITLLVASFFITIIIIIILIVIIFKIRKKKK